MLAADVMIAPGLPPEVVDIDIPDPALAAQEVAIETALQVGLDAMCASTASGQIVGADLQLTNTATFACP